MKAIVIHEYGPPDLLSYEEVPDPIPRAGEIRIRVQGATVNRVLDVSLRAGRETGRGPVLPLIPGVDCAGVVDAVGPEVSRWQVGDRVAAEGVMPLGVCAEDGIGYHGARGMMGINLLEQNTDIRVIQVLLGHAKLENTAALHASRHQDDQSGRQPA
jgi:NADPH:quinone reductase-like Zn-dependent oxidoreductase